MRSPKSSGSSAIPPSVDTGVDETSVFFGLSDSLSPAEQETYSELYDELHNKLNWLTVRSSTIEVLKYNYFIQFKLI